MAIEGATAVCAGTPVPFRRADLELLLTALAGPAIALDGTGTIQFANPAAEALLGWADGGLCGQPFSVILPRAIRPAFSGGQSGFLSESSARLLGRTTRLRALRKDEQAVELELTLNRLPLAEGELFIAILRDIPERAELEHQLTISGYMRAATRAAALLSTRLELDHVLDTVVETLADDFSALFARVWLCDEAQQSLVLRAGRGQQDDAGKREPIPLSSTDPIATVARLRVPLVRNGLGDDPQFDREWVRRERIAAAAILPLSVGTELRGVFACFFDRPLEGELIEVLLAFAAMVATSLNDVNLYQREQVARAEAEAAQRWLNIEREAAEARARQLAEANETLKRRRDELEAARSRLAAQYTVLRALSQAATIEEAAPRILEAMGLALGWDVGALWMVDRKVSQLKLVDIWQGPGVSTPGFVERTRRRTYAPGEGQVGRVWQTGEPAWVVDASRQPSFRRAELAAQEGLHGAIWFPIRHGNEVYGVVELFRRDETSPDEESLSSTAALGNQIGQFVESVRAQRALREGEERHDITLRSIGDAVITTDTEGLVDFMNPMAETLTGWPVAEAWRRPLAEVFRVADEVTREPLDGPDERVLRQGRVVGLASQAILWGRDGREAMIDGTGAPIRSEDGELRGVVLVFRDVTEKKRDERRRRFIAEASAHLAASLDYSTALNSVAHLAVAGLADLCTVDLVDGERAIHSLAVAHADASKQELAQELRRRWAPELDAAMGVGQVLRSGEPALYPQLAEAQLAAMARDAEHFSLLQRLHPVSLVIVPLVARGRTLGALQLVSCDARRRYDAADLGMAEDLARRASQSIDNARLFHRAQEAVRAREEFLSIASHELKTPLTSLQLQVQSLLRASANGETITADRAQAKLQSADRQTSRLSALINNLLDVSRITEGRLQLDPEPLDLAVVVREVAERLADQLSHAGCDLEIDAPAGSTGLWDKLRIEQMVTNLFSNALKYGAGKPIRVRVTTDDATVTLTVTDHGIGINPSDVERIFARFERAVSARHYGGLGVGLFIVKRVLDAMGGTVEVESAPGSGATFRVKLPRGEESARKPEPATAGDELRP